MDYSWIGPAVTAAIITAIITLFTTHRNNSLDYITSERSTWRLRIKTAIQELLATFCDSAATELALQKIKSELNPYGKFTENLDTAQPVQSSPSKPKFKSKKKIDNDLFFLLDGHIWNSISSYEANPFDRKALDTLIVLLELLLKFDWDRSKREVAGFSILVPTILSCIFGAVSFALGTTNETDPSKIVSYVAAIMVISLLCILVPPYCLFKCSASYEPSTFYMFLASIFVMAPSLISSFLFSANMQHFSMLVAAIFLLFSALLSIFAFAKRDIERKYISMIKKAVPNGFQESSTTSRTNAETSASSASPT